MRIVWMYYTSIAMRKYNLGECVWIKPPLHSGNPAWTKAPIVKVELCPGPLGNPTWIYSVCNGRNVYSFYEMTLQTFAWMRRAQLNQT